MGGGEVGCAPPLGPDLCLRTAGGGGGNPRLVLHQTLEVPGTAQTKHQALWLAVHGPQGGTAAFGIDLEVLEVHGWRHLACGRHNIEATSAFVKSEQDGEGGGQHRACPCDPSQGSQGLGDE